MSSTLTTVTGPELGLNTGMTHALGFYRLSAVITVVF